MEGMTDFSPAAQQVFWEFNRAASGKPEDWHYLPAIAAALRAAADQVVPEGYDQAYDCCLEIVSEIRADFLAIAADLEALN
jgi:hypothetical protein